MLCLCQNQEKKAFLCQTEKVMNFVGDWLVSVPKHLALDVHGVQLSVVVLGDDLHYILLLEGIFIHPLHGTHTLDRDGGAHLQQFSHKPQHQLTQVCTGG